MKNALMVVPVGSSTSNMPGLMSNISLCASATKASKQMGRAWRPKYCHSSGVLELDIAAVSNVDCSSKGSHSSHLKPTDKYPGGALPAGLGFLVALITRASVAALLMPCAKQMAVG